MEKKPPLVMTPFDESLTNDFLQLVKIILPYLPDHVQRIAGIYVKLTELMNAFYCFQPPYYHNRRGRLRKQEKDPGSMFEAVVPYLSPEKREMFDSFSGIWQMMEMMKEMDFGDPANMADMMNGFQTAQDMTDMMSGFQTERMDENERMDGASGSCESGSAETGADPAAALKAGGKNGKALVPVMMSLIAGANKRGIRFTPDEISLILSAIKEGKSKQEQAQIDQMVQMIRTIQAGKQPPRSGRQ